MDVNDKLDRIILLLTSMDKEISEMKQEMNGRFDSIEAHLEKHDSQLAAIVEGQHAAVEGLHRRIDKLEEKLDVKIADLQHQSNINTLDIVKLRKAE